jgi:transcriptional regulator with XRE-family HTH domain
MNPHDLTGQFGSRLREIREMRGLSQEALADAAGIHRTHVSLIERNKRAVRLDTLFRLASALECDAADLVRGLTNPSPAAVSQELIEFNRLFPFVREVQTLASRHGIDDIFQDNGGKLLQTLIVLKLHRLGRREGNDAFDDEGREYELKMVNVRLTKSFSTHHHLNPRILQKYRTVEAWFFSIYEDIELREIYRMTPAQLEPYFQEWEGVWKKRGRDLNNPKIPVSFVRREGIAVYPVPGISGAGRAPDG